MTKAVVKSLIVFTGVFCLFTDGFAQGWQWQNPLPQGNPLLAIDFVDSLNGWIAGAAGTLIHTTDGGENWQVQVTDAVALFYGIDFIDPLVGWGAGANNQGGAIARTTDGGESWHVSLSDTLTSLYKAITFVDERHGWVAGRNGAIVHTDDGGLTWQRQESGTLENLDSIVFVDTLRGWAIGELSPLLQTSDGGKTWVSHSEIRYGRKVVFVDSLLGWLLTPTFPAVLKTTDGGKTWTLVRDFGAADTGNDMVFVDSLRGWVVVDGSVARTRDGGDTWEFGGGNWKGIFFFKTGLRVGV